MASNQELTTKTSLHLHQQYADGGDSEIHEAAKDGDARRLVDLISEGVSVNSSTHDSITPLHYACLAGYEQCVDILLKAGASVNALDIDGASPLCEACVAGSAACVKLLLDAGAVVNINLNFSTPLHEAVLRGHAHLCQILVDAGGSLNANDLHFGTPLHVAAIKDDIKCAHILLKAGARANALKLHQTPLHLAVRHQSTAMVSLLINFGADVQLQNLRGLAPSNMALKSTPVHQLLIHTERTPSTLSQLCRRRIHSFLIQHFNLDLILQLLLPKRIQAFLVYDHPWCGVLNCNGIICGRQAIQ